MSLDVLTQLRSYAEQLDAQAASYEELAAPPTSPRRGEEPRQRRSRRGWAIAIAAAVITVLVVAIPLLLLGGGSDESPVVTEPSPQPTVVTTVPPPTTQPSTEPTAAVEEAAPAAPVAPDLTWTRVESPSFAGEGAQSMNAVASDGSLMVAVGAENPSPTPSGEGERAAVWVTANGVDWDRIPHDDQVFGSPSVMSDVTVGGPGFVAVGSAWADWGTEEATSVALAWTSPDGTTWTRAEQPEGEGGPERFFAMEAVIPGGPGLIAVGWDFDRDSFEGNAAVWTSIDGSSWDRVADSGAVFAQGLMRDIAPYEGGYIAVGARRGQLFVGTRGCTDSDVCPAAAWTSPDGLNWSRIDSIVFDGNWAEISEVAVSGSDAVAAGIGAEGQAAFWTFDGLNEWQRVPPSGFLFGDTDGVADLVFDGDRLMAIGARPNWSGPWDENTEMPINGDGVVWVSADKGVTWEKSPTDPAFTGYMDPIPRMASVMLLEDAFLVVGAVENDAAVWIGQWNE